MIIEFVGASGSGKSYTYEKLYEFLTKTTKDYGIKIHKRNEIINLLDIYFGRKKYLVFIKYIIFLINKNVFFIIYRILYFSITQKTNKLKKIAFFLKKILEFLLARKLIEKTNNRIVVLFDEGLINFIGREYEFSEYYKKISKIIDLENKNDIFYIFINNNVDTIHNNLINRPKRNKYFYKLKNNEQRELIKKALKIYEDRKKIIKTKTKNYIEIDNTKSNINYSEYFNKLSETIKNNVKCKDFKQKKIHKN